MQEAGAYTFVCACIFHSLCANNHPIEPMYLLVGAKIGVNSEGKVGYFAFWMGARSTKARNL